MVSLEEDATSLEEIVFSAMWRKLVRKQAGKHIFASHPMHELRKCGPCAWWESHF